MPITALGLWVTKAPYYNVDYCLSFQGLYLPNSRSSPASAGIIIDNITVQGPDARVVGLLFSGCLHPYGVSSSLWHGGHSNVEEGIMIIIIMRADEGQVCTEIHSINKVCQLKKSFFSLLLISIVDDNPAP